MPVVLQALTNCQCTLPTLGSAVPMAAARSGGACLHHVNARSCVNCHGVAFFLASKTAQQPCSAVHISCSSCSVHNGWQSHPNIPISQRLHCNLPPVAPSTGWGGAERRSAAESQDPQLHRAEVHMCGASLPSCNHTAAGCVAPLLPSVGAGLLPSHKGALLLPASNQDTGTKA